MIKFLLRDRVTHTHTHRGEGKRYFIMLVTYINEDISNGSLVSHTIYMEMRMPFGERGEGNQY